MEAWAARDWTLARLAELCPDAQLPVYRYDPSSVSWAGLVDGGQKLLSEYLQQDFGRGEQANVLYGLEMTLRTECPRLLEDLPISRLFVGSECLRPRSGHRRTRNSRSTWPPTRSCGIREIAFVDTGPPGHLWEHAVLDQMRAQTARRRGTWRQHGWGRL